MLEKLFNGYTLDISTSIKTQNGAAGCQLDVSTFLDIYIQRDLDNGLLTGRRTSTRIN